MTSLSKEQIVKKLKEDFTYWYHRINLGDGIVTRDFTTNHCGTISGRSGRALIIRIKSSLILRLSTGFFPLKLKNWVRRPSSLPIACTVRSGISCSARKCWGVNACRIITFPLTICLKDWMCFSRKTMIMKNPTTACSILSSIWGFCIISATRC